mgnify:CR=1 FL=1
MVTEPIYTAIDPEKKELEGVIRKGRVIAEKPALPNSIKRGKPTYPKPITPMTASLFLIFFISRFIKSFPFSNLKNTFYSRFRTYQIIYLTQ